MQTYQHNCPSLAKWWLRGSISSEPKSRPSIQAKLILGSATLSFRAAFKEEMGTTPKMVLRFMLLLGARVARAWSTCLGYHYYRPSHTARGSIDISEKSKYFLTSFTPGPSLTSENNLMVSVRLRVYYRLLSMHVSVRGEFSRVLAFGLLRPLGTSTAASTLFWHQDICSKFSASD